jgi:hypothetical protein
VQLLNCSPFIHHFRCLELKSSDWFQQSSTQLLRRSSTHLRCSRELTLSAWGLLHATSVAPRRLRFEDKLPHGTVLVLGPMPGRSSRCCNREFNRGTALTVCESMYLSAGELASLRISVRLRFFEQLLHASSLMPCRPADLKKVPPRLELPPSPPYAPCVWCECGGSVEGGGLGQNGTPAEVFARD